MLSKFSKWELGFVHYIAKFTILRLFVISRFEYIALLFQLNDIYQDSTYVNGLLIILQVLIG